MWNILSLIPTLRHVLLSNNQISTIQEPRSCLQRMMIQKLDLSNNTLSAEFDIICLTNLGALGVLNLSGNHCVVNRETIRKAFKDAFAKAGLPCFKPHSIRDTLTQLGQKICRTPEEYKAWSQNLGHDDVLVTFTSYGQVASKRQAEIQRRPYCRAPILAMGGSSRGAKTRRSCGSISSV